jgi:hypothetical protein
MTEGCDSFESFKDCNHHGGSNWVREGLGMSDCHMFACTKTTNCHPTITSCTSPSTSAASTHTEGTTAADVKCRHLEGPVRAVGTLNFERCPLRWKTSEHNNIYITESVTKITQPVCYICEALKIISKIKCSKILFHLRDVEFFK